MAKPKPIVLPPEPQVKVYEVMKVLIDVMTNEKTPIGAFVEMKEDEAEVFVRKGALRLTNKRPQKPKKEGSK